MIYFLTAHVFTAFPRREQHNELFRLFDAMKRKQLDVRNSEFFHEIADDWNNGVWAPTSIQFAKFAVTVDLSLTDTAITMTAELAEKS